MPLDASEVAIDLLQDRVAGTPLVTMINPVWNNVLDDLPVSGRLLQRGLLVEFLEPGLLERRRRFHLRGDLSHAPARRFPDARHPVHQRPLFGKGEELEPGYFRFEGRERRFWTPEYAEAEAGRLRHRTAGSKTAEIAGTEYGVLEIIAVK